MASSSWLLPEAPTQDPSRGAKIRWEKCHTDLYREIVQESLSAAPILAPLSDLDADMCVRSLTNVMHLAAKAASPSPRKKRSKKGFPIWNEAVAAAVPRSKMAHYQWKCAGRPRDNSTVVYVISCRNFWLQYRNIQDGGPNKHENVSSF